MLPARTSPSCGITSRRRSSNRRRPRPRPRSDRSKSWRRRPWRPRPNGCRPRSGPSRRRLPASHGLLLPYPARPARLSHQPAPPAPLASPALPSPPPPRRQETTAMRFSELIAGIAGTSGVPPGAPPALDPSGPLAARDPEVTGVTHDSRRVESGDLYVALPGERYDGWDFAAAAVAAGAVAVAGAPPREWAPAAALTVPWAPLADPRGGLAALAARVHGHPDRELVLAGVTGTNGKTTVALLIAAMLDSAGLPAGFLGTLGHRFAERDFAGGRGRGHTTPEASDLFRTLRQMRAAGARAAARSEEHTSELQSPVHLVCRLLLEKKKQNPNATLTVNKQIIRQKQK